MKVLLCNAFYSLVHCYWLQKHAVNLHSQGSRDSIKLQQNKGEATMQEQVTNKPLRTGQDF